MWVKSMPTLQRGMLWFTVSPRKFISTIALTGPFRRARHSFTNGLLCLASFTYPFVSYCALI